MAEPNRKLAQASRSRELMKIHRNGAAQVSTGADSEYEQSDTDSR